MNVSSISDSLLNSRVSVSLLSYCLYSARRPECGAQFGLLSISSSRYAETFDPRARLGSLLSCWALFEPPCLLRALSGLHSLYRVKILRPPLARAPLGQHLRVLGEPPYRIS